MVYPALLPLMRTPRLPVADWSNAPADLNWLVRFAERRNLVSARVPSHFKRSLLSEVCVQWSVRLFTVFAWFRAFQKCWSGIFWKILIWCQLPLLLSYYHCWFFTFRMRSIAIVKSYFKIYSASFLITFQSPETAMSVNRHYNYNCCYYYKDS